MSEHGHLWESDEEFRQSVIRKALLMGFSAQQNLSGQWGFHVDGAYYPGYRTLYAAARSYLIRCGGSHFV